MVKYWKIMPVIYYNCYTPTTTSCYYYYYYCNYY